MCVFYSLNNHTLTPKFLFRTLYFTSKNSESRIPKSNITSHDLQIFAFTHNFIISTSPGKKKIFISRILNIKNYELKIKTDITQLAKYNKLYAIYL